MRTTFIYSLENPVTGEVRYIGKADNLKNRLSVHLCEKGKYKKVNWIKSLKNQGLLPEIKVIDEVPYDDWQFWERYWIAQFKAWGFRLTNDSEGGEGLTYWLGKKRDDPAYIAKQRAFMLSDKNPIRGKVRPDEWSKGISEGRKKQSIKPFIQYDAATGEFIAKWNNIIDASEKTGCAEATICSILKKNPQSKTSGGFYFHYDEGTLLPKEEVVTLSTPKSKEIPVIQMDKQGNFIKEWPSVIRAAEELKIKAGNVYTHLSGKRPNAGGFTWKYKSTTKNEML